MIRFLVWQNALLAAALFACSARAEPTEADRATARELATAGYHALKRGDYGIAADHFQRADALVHAPTLVVDWGRALAGLGLLVEAGEKYALVIREGIEPGAPASWQRAHADARTELDALQPRLAWLTVSVSGPDTPAITIDRIHLPDAAVGAARATNPGKHAIRVRAPGYESEARTVTLAEGERRLVEIALLPLPGDSLAAEPQPSQPEPPTIPKKSGSEIESGPSGTRRALVYAAFAAGGAGLIVGGLTGAMALHEKAELESACSGDICPASERDDIEDYHRLGIASGIGLGIAAIGIGTGVTLLLTEPKGPSDTAKRRTGIWPYVGAGTIGAIGRY
jgi:hypothetical protein